MLRMLAGAALATVAAAHAKYVPLNPVSRRDGALASRRVATSAPPHRDRRFRYRTARSHS